MKWGSGELIREEERIELVMTGVKRIKSMSACFGDVSLTQHCVKPMIVK
jgi:hypothetical protein